MELTSIFLLGCLVLLAILGIIYLLFQIASPPIAILLTIVFIANMF